ATFAKQLEEPFKQLQDMADTEFAQLQGKTKTLSAAYEAAMPSDAGQKKEMIDCQKTMRTAEAKFSKEDLQNAGILGDPTSAEGDRNAARAALQKSQPDWLKAADRWKELAGDKLPALLKAQGDIIQHTQNVNQALDNQFYSRYLMARMMLETGNKDGAKAQALAAFGAVPKSSREILWNREGDPKQDGSKTYPIREIATQAGITKADIDKLPEPTLKVVAPANDGKGDKGDKADGKGDKQDDKPDTSGLNPRFAKMEIAELDKFAHEKAQSLETLADAKDAFEELVKRYDLMLNDKEIEKSLAAQKLFLEALQKGKAAVPESKDEKTGQIIPAHVGDQPLTEEQRWNYHLTMYSDMETMAKQVQYRQELAELLKAAKQ
ncbi:MAG TPA: hypothetical protein VFA15_06110, partial [Nitrososphaera sp.]|nr:hypothetical protein [Nitrososphaera sp.]